MIALRRIAEKIDDRINPIAVKELRQAVRSGLVTGGFILFVLGLTGAMGMYLLNKGEISFDFQGGSEVFMTLTIILMAVTMILVPLYASGRLAAERGATHADLLFVTTLSSGRIVRGKTMAALVLTIVVYSACTPFITFTYLLRGIDFPTIVLILVLSFMLSATAIQLAVMIGAIPISGVFRIMLGLGAIVLGISLLTVLFDDFGIFAHYIERGVNGWAGLWKMWPGLLTLLVLDLLIIGLFYVLTVAVLVPPAANRTVGVRLYLMFMWLVMGIGAVLWMVEFNALVKKSAYLITKPTPPLLILTWGWWGFLTACMVLAISERESWGPRITRRIPRNGLLRAGAFVLYTGSAGGVTWILMMIGLTAGATKIAENIWPAFDWSDNKTTHIMIGLTLFAYAYCMTAALVRRYMITRMPAKHTGLLALALLCAGCLVPMILGYILISSPYGSSMSHRLANKPGWWNVTNPFMLFERPCRNACLATAAIWAFAVAILSVPWYMDQVSRFIPLHKHAGADPAEGPSPPTAPRDSQDLTLPAVMVDPEIDLPDGLDTVNTDEDAPQ